MPAPRDRDETWIEPAALGARRVALRLLDDARAASARLGTDGDDEALHDFRVAVRRLRSWLRAFREETKGTLGGRLRRALGDVAEATGASRDLEVLAALVAGMTARGAAEASALRELGARLARGRKAADRRALEAGRTFAALEPELRDALGRWLAPVQREAGAPSLATRLAALVRRDADELRDALRSVRGAEDQEEAHRARIAGKRVRYLLEPVAGRHRSAAACVAELKRLQDLLGDMHDAHVLERRAEELRSAPQAGRRALALRLRRRVETLHRRLAKGGIVRRAAALHAGAQAAARELDRAGSGGQEHERKYLLSSMPPRALRGERRLLEQGWLPGSAIVERIRRDQGRSVAHWRTIKAGRGVSRLEAEERIPASLFRALWPLTEGRRIRKERFVVREGDLAWEIDRFLDRDLVLAEVELPSPDAPAPVPAWLAPRVVRDVTGEDAYVNRNLAERRPPADRARSRRGPADRTAPRERIRARRRRPSAR